MTDPGSIIQAFSLDIRDKWNTYLVPIKYDYSLFMLVITSSNDIPRTYSL